MCMDSGPFLLVRGEQEESLADVNSILAGANGLKLIDVYGKTRDISGKIVELDLLNRRVTIG